MALLLVGLIGLGQLLEPSDRPHMLGFLEGSAPPIVRSSDQLHRFPALGIAVEVNNGWTYLSVADDVEAVAPTFVHKDSQSIVRLEPFQLRSWPPAANPLQTELVGELEWEWTEVDHRRVGRLRVPPIDLMILAVTHQPDANLNREVREFCAAIRLLR